jgi:hypothetical protein
MAEKDLTAAPIPLKIEVDDADRIVWPRLKKYAEQINRGSFKVNVAVHRGRIRSIEMYDARESVATF